MRRLGRIARAVKKDLALVKIENSKNIPKIGEKVYGPDLGVLGKILDIIGRVEEPFAVVKPLRSDTDFTRMIGQLVYTKKFTGNKQGRKKRPNKRRR